MEKATQHFPQAFSARKLHEVKRFALNLRKRSRINLLAQQVLAAWIPFLSTPNSLAIER
jgi:hypothetical protein